MAVGRRVGDTIHNRYRAFEPRAFAVAACFVRARNGAKGAGYLCDNARVDFAAGWVLRPAGLATLRCLEKIYSRDLRPRAWLRISARYGHRGGEMSDGPRGAMITRGGLVCASEERKGCEKGTVGPCRAFAVIQRRSCCALYFAYIRAR